jgi:hypothetical protein
MVNLTHLLKSHLNKNIRILFPLYSNMKTGKKLGLVGKVILGAGAIASLFSGDAKANTLSTALDCDNPAVQTSSAQLTHHSQPELFDMLFLDGHSPAIDIFYLDGSTEMKGIGKLADSMETETDYIRGRGLSAPVNAQLSANISEASFCGEFPENNMVNKKVIGELYDANGTSDPNDDILLGTYDCWNMTESGYNEIPITVRNGPSYRWLIKFYNTNLSDFNNDGKVDFKDWAILAGEYKNGVPGNYLSDISGPEGKSDGVIDAYDIAEFSANWLAE